MGHPEPLGGTKRPRSTSVRNIARTSSTISPTKQLEVAIWRDRPRVRSLRDRRASRSCLPKPEFHCLRIGWSSGWRSKSVTDCRGMMPKAPAFRPMPTKSRSTLRSSAEFAFGPASNAPSAPRTSSSSSVRRLRISSSSIRARAFRRMRRSSNVSLPVFRRGATAKLFRYRKKVGSLPITPLGAATRIFSRRSRERAPWAWSSSRAFFVTSTRPSIGGKFDFKGRSRLCRRRYNHGQLHRDR